MVSLSLSLSMKDIMNYSLLCNLNSLSPFNVPAPVWRHTLTKQIFCLSPYRIMHIACKLIVYRPITAPGYILGHSMALAYLVGNIAVVGALWWILSKESKAKDEYLVEHPEMSDFQDSEENLKLGDRHLRWRFNV